MLIGTLFAFAITAEGSATELHVGVGQQYSTIQAAVNAAWSNDVILVHAGTYAEQVVIDDVDVSFLTIKAYSTDYVLIDCPDDKVNAIIARNVDLRLKGIHIESPNHSQPATRSIRMITSTAASEMFSLTLCDLTMTDHNIAGSVAIQCSPDNDDDVEVWGDNVTFDAFSTILGAQCTYTSGWEDVPDVCSGW